MFVSPLVGTDNSQADTSLNQAGLWALGARNTVIGNRFANSFNGMFYEGVDFRFGVEYALGLVDDYFGTFGVLEGNTFHHHGRFGTYILGIWPKVNCTGTLASEGYQLPAPNCKGFTPSGDDNGLPAVVVNNVDYGNAFVGGYSVGDLQYGGHTSVGNLNNLYWKTTKNFADGCSAHVSNGTFIDGNIALPDMAAFIIENSLFSRDTQLETNHHCNAGITGYLCMPTYVLHNVQWRSTSKSWVEWSPIANNNGTSLHVGHTIHLA